MQSVINAILASKTIKVSTGITLGSGIVAFLMGMIDKVDKDTKIYVDTKHEQVMDHVEHLKGGQEDIKKMLRDINNHLLRKKEQ